MADELGIAYNTAVKWCRRFAESDIDGLADRRRSGRPVSVGVDDVRAVLATPLRPAPSGGWSTRAIARELGLSQTAVSRIRRRAFGATGDPPPVILSGPQLLVWVHVAPGFRALGFQTPATVPALPVTARHRRRPPDGTEHVRVVLSAGVALSTGTRGRGGIPGDTADPVAEESDDLVAHLRRLHALVPPDRRATVVLDTEAGRSDIRWLHRNPRFGLVTVEPERWLNLLEEVSSAIDPRQSEEMADLADRIRRWSVSDGPVGRSFDWHHVPSVVGRAEGGVPDAASTVEGGRRPNLAEAVAGALRESLANGTFHAGERIPEAPLAARLGVSRGPIRDALHVLAEEGLIELRPHRGAYVPAPSRRDVFDTYSGRGPLGALLLRRLAVRPDRDLGEVVDGHSVVLDLAAAGDVARTSEADIRWQDTCARAAGMPRVEKMFTRLSLQLRLFISIMGLDYGYSVDDIVADNEAILRALQLRDAELVTALWRRKIEAAVRYMAAQLGDEGG